jgi:cation transport ATPase
MKLQHIVSQAHKARRLTQIIILLSFVVSFAVIRLVTHLQRIGALPNQTWDPHIHHLVPGILLLIVTGYVGISFWHLNWVRRLMAVLYGLGAAMTLDEFALWLHLEDVYWLEQGRASIDAVVIMIVLLTLAVILNEVLDKHKYTDSEGD